MSIRVTEAKKGMVISYEGDLYRITSYEHVTPGNWRAIHHLTLKNLKTGRQKELRMSTSDTVEPVFLDKRNCQYLYKDASGHVFMDNQGYEQFTLPEDVIADALPYISIGDNVDVVFRETQPLSVEVPPTVTLEVTQAEDAVKGDSVTNLQKLAMLSTGHKLKVPLHIKVGEKVRISTDSGEFLGRSND